MEFHTEYLGKPFVPAWIYGDVDPHNEEFDQTIQAVERALGFKLFVWQKAFINRGEFRQMGATTAKILRELLNVSGEPIDYSRPSASKWDQFYREELRRIKCKLDEAGIPTRLVWFSERDKHYWLHR